MEGDALAPGTPPHVETSSIDISPLLETSITPETDALAFDQSITSTINRASNSESLLPDVEHNNDGSTEEALFSLPNEERITPRYLREVSRKNARKRKREQMFRGDAKSRGTQEGNGVGEGTGDGVGNGDDYRNRFRGATTSGASFLDRMQAAVDLSLSSIAHPA